MNRITADMVAAELADWAGHKYFNEISALEAGWEWWLQTDFAGWLLAKDAVLDVQREVAIYTNAAQRVDLWFNGSFVVGERIAIEIKCQTPKNAGFIGQVDADAAKLAAANIAVAQQGCQRYMLAGVIDDHAAGELRARDYLRVFDGSTSMHLYMKRITA